MCHRAGWLAGWLAAREMLDWCVLDSSTLTPVRSHQRSHHSHTSVRSLAKLGYRPSPATLELFAGASARLLGQASAQDLSLLAYSFAVLGFKPSEAWWAAYWGASCSSMDQASSQALANSFWALGRLKKVCEEGGGGLLVRCDARHVCPWWQPASSTTTTLGTHCPAPACCAVSPATHNHAGAAAPVAAALPGLHGRLSARVLTPGAQQRAVGCCPPAAAAAARQLAGQPAGSPVSGAFAWMGACTLRHCVALSRSSNSNRPDWLLLLFCPRSGDA